jgi:hypothetical protein
MSTRQPLKRRLTQDEGKEEEEEEELGPSTAKKVHQDINNFMSNPPQL